MLVWDGHRLRHKHGCGAPSLSPIATCLHHFDAWGCSAPSVPRAALIEISVNPPFAAFLGLAGLIPLGSFILLRVHAVRDRVRWAGGVAGLGAVTVLAGLLCVFFQPSWFTTLTPECRLPLYMTLGIATSFAMSFAFVEVLNWCMVPRQFPRAPTSALVSNPAQVLLLAVGSIGLGFACGLVFGVSGIGLKHGSSARARMLREEAVVLPIGMVLGTAGAVFNEIIRDAMQRRARTPAPGAGGVFQHDEDTESVLSKWGSILYGRPYADHVSYQL